MKKILHFLQNWIYQNQSLTIILILAAVLRFGGIYPGYPPTHADEGAIYSTAVKMILHTTYDPMRYDYAALPMIIHAVVYIIVDPFFILYSFILAPENLPKFNNFLYFYQHILLQNLQTAVIYWGRFITAAFGLGVVFMVYQVTAKFFKDKRIGLVSALLTAINFRQVLNSHITLPDIYNAFFLLLCFYFFAKLLEKPSTKNYLLTGIIIGLYSSVKFHIFSIPAFFMVHVVNVWNSLSSTKLSYITENKKLLFKKLFRFNFIVSLFLIPAVFIIVNPYIFVHWNEFLKVSYYQSRQYRLGTNNLDVYSLSYLFHFGIGKLVSIFILLGIILGIKKYALPSLLFLSAIIPIFYFLTYYGNGGFYTRNFVSITPLMLIFAGLFLVEICLLIGKSLRLGKNAINCFIIIATIIISWDQIQSSFINTFYFAEPTSYKTALIWFQNNIPTGSTISARTVDNFPKKKLFKIVNFEYSDTYSLAEMQAKGVDYAYVPLDEFTIFFYWWMKQDTSQAISYWEKQVPDSISQNMYQAKVAQELQSWSIANFIRPWQAPDVNYFVVKVPKKVELTKKKVISQFTFDTENDLSSWFRIAGYDKTAVNISFDGLNGHQNKGSVKIDGSAFPNSIRAFSPVIPLLNPNKAYEITGWIKTGDILQERKQEKTKDGYFEVDFYEKDPTTIDLATGSLYSSVSSRVSGTTDWVQKDITVIPPQNARFMTVSFGVNNHETPIWFDDVTVFESEETYSDPRVSPPYLNYPKFPDNILFPVSHGNL